LQDFEAQGWTFCKASTLQVENGKRGWGDEMSLIQMNHGWSKGWKM